MKSCKHIDDSGREVTEIFKNIHLQDQSQTIKVNSPTASVQSSDVLNEGDLIGNCRIEKILGCGGMGVVYLAKHTVLDTFVAIKVFSATIFQLKYTDYPPERFLREAKIAVRIKHPNVVTVLDAGFESSRNLYYIIMEFMGGGTMREMVKEYGTLSEENSLNVMISVLNAMAIANRNNIVHRDIKPDNIMMTDDGIVKLADLGLAKEIQQHSDKHITADNTTLGSPPFMSPEQATDFKNADIRSDLYSLGATLFYILTGKPPFIGETPVNIILKVINENTPDPRSLRPDISPEIAELCVKLMAKNPADRFQTPEEVVAEIQSIAARKRVEIQAVPLEEENSTEVAEDV